MKKKNERSQEAMTDHEPNADEANDQEKKPSQIQDRN